MAEGTLTHMLLQISSAYTRVDPRILLPFALLHCACAGTEAAPAKSGKAPEAAPASVASSSKKDTTSRCSKASRNGTYKVQLQGLSSNCQRAADYDEVLKDGIAPLGTDCSFDKPDKWSDDGCTLERAYSCKDAGGSTTRTILVSTQNADDASILAGILSIRKLDKSGSETCQGTYKFISSRD